MSGTDPSPTLRDLVTDPIALLLMRRDGVEPAEVVELMATMKRALGQRRRDAGASRAAGTSAPWRALPLCGCRRDGEFGRRRWA